MAKSGIVALADGVRAYFDVNGVAATVARVGLKYRTFLANQGPGGGSRVVFIPGDFGGDASVRPLDEGQFAGPLHHVSDNPRELVEWQRTVTMSVWGVDATQTEDEQAQIEATEDLLEWAVRGVHNAVSSVELGDVVMATHLGADVEWGKVTRAYPPLENSFGSELLVRFTLKGPLFDVATQTVTAIPKTLTKSVNAAA